MREQGQVLLAERGAGDVRAAPALRLSTGCGTSLRKSNPWVTADALSVLAAAGRLS